MRHEREDRDVAQQVPGSGAGCIPSMPASCSISRAPSSTSQKTDWPKRASFAWDMLGARYYEDFDRALMLRAGEVLGIATKTAQRLLDALAGSIVRAAADLHARVEQANAALLAGRPQLAATLGGESTCLRVIRHTIIAEMTRRLCAS
ncbi:putative HipA protein [Candidatus Paraburkholderia kirkii]|nr:putative HipA protein [Candidatus Paraburkholderia kirkii]